jgi:hypothetical protein
LMLFEQAREWLLDDHPDGRPSLRNALLCKLPFFLGHYGRAIRNEPSLHPVRVCRARAGRR